MNDSRLSFTCIILNKNNIAAKGKEALKKRKIFVDLLARMRYDKSVLKMNDHEVSALVRENQYLGGCTDSRLAAMVKEGNSEAFVELTARYLSLIRAKAAPFHNTMLDADDLCQEGLLGLLNAARTYSDDRGAEFKTYAGICIHNHMVMAYRWAAGKKNLPMKNFVSLGDTVSCSVSLQPETDPEAMLLDRENMSRLKQRIKKNLSKMEHQVLLLYLGGCSYCEIADSLGITSKAADNALQRVRRKLKEPF